MSLYFSIFTCAFHNNFYTETSSDNIALLQEALVVFREIRRGQLGQGSAPEDDLHLNCEMMAALLMLQNSEAEQYLADFASEVSAMLSN